MSERVFWDVDTQVDFMLPEGKLYVRRGGDRRGEPREAHGPRACERYPDRGELRQPRCERRGAVRQRRTSGDTFPPHCMRGTPGQARIPETDAARPSHCRTGRRRGVRRDADSASHAGDILFHKHYFDVFTNPHVAPTMRGARHLRGRPLRCRAGRLRPLCRGRAAGPLPGDRGLRGRRCRARTGRGWACSAARWVASPRRHAGPHGGGPGALIRRTRRLFPSRQNSALFSSRPAFSDRPAVTGAPLCWGNTHQASDAALPATEHRSSAFERCSRSTSCHCSCN